MATSRAEDNEFDNQTWLTGYWPLWVSVEKTSAKPY